MQLNKVSFIGADFEIGQTRKGLSDSSDFFIEYLDKFKNIYQLNFEKIGQIKHQIKNQSIHCFSDLDLFKIDMPKYEDLALMTWQGLQVNSKCLNFGGDHSIAIATIDATLRKSSNTHVIWIDAHADANNTEESFSGNFHGMPAYYLMQKNYQRPLPMQWMQKTVSSQQITYIGLRDLDAFEVLFLKKMNIKFFTSDEVKKLGINYILNYLEEKNKNFDHIHLSFDIDSLDPKYGLCTGVPVPGGLSLPDTEEIFKLICNSNKLINADFVEINPKMAKSHSELNNIYFLSLHLLQALLGTKNLNPSNRKEINHDFIHH